MLELGGKDPMVVLDDADVEVASSAAVWGAFMNAGQTCLSVERCYVHERIYEAFLKACVEKTNKLRIGNGADHSTDIGPLIHQRQVKTVQTHVEDAIARGARLLAGGHALAHLGPNFFAPTVLADVNHSMLIMREDDRPETARRRITVYLEQTLPVLAHYRQQHVVSDIDGIGSIEEVRGRILRAIEGRRPQETTSLRADPGRGGP